MEFVLDIGLFYCFCGNFLFNSGDVCFKTVFMEQLYLWVKPERRESKIFYGRVSFRSPNHLMCSICHHKIIAVIWPYGGEREILRFHNNLFYQKKMFLIKKK